MQKKLRVAALALASLVSLPALAQGKVTFKDPTGDDKGPGKYVYPTDGVYKKGSFDLTEFSFEKKGDKADVVVSFASALEDQWNMGTGFSVQMVFVFIDKDGKEGSGNTEGLPGLNVQFAPGHEWEKVIILSPQNLARVKKEAETKAPAVKDAVVVPLRTKGTGKKVTGTINFADLGEGDPTQWSYQVVVQSNEGFPGGTDLLTRKVNEYEGQHRFGGGTDGDCDPHVMDLLAGEGKGEASEKDAQYAMLAYECDGEGNATKKATLTTVGRKPAAMGAEQK